MDTYKNNIMEKSTCSNNAVKLSNFINLNFKAMRTKHLTTMAVAALIVTASCQKDQVNGPDNLDAANLVAYTPVTETPTTKAINASVLGDNFSSFDAQQAWFDFTTISTTAQGHASNRNAWHLGFYSQSGTINVNGTASNLLAYLNYTVNTQGKLIEDVTTVDAAIGETSQLEGALTLFDGGTFGMGDLSTFDFHREGEFVIGTPVSTSRVYLIRTSEAVQIHPDSTTTTRFWLVSVRWTGSAYNVQYQAAQRTAANNWSLDGALSPVTPIAKSTDYQSRFLNFTTGITDAIQPQVSDWNLGLSAVVLKRYVNADYGGGAYPFALKGVVLNNNPAVQVYRVQTTGSTAGAPGPYDPNYTWQNDPALDNSNDITTQFDDFVAADINDSLFSGDSQEEIGQYYRYLDMGNYNVFVDRFYVIKLQNGDVYKLRFLPLGTTGNSSAVNNGIQIKYAKIATTP